MLDELINQQSNSARLTNRVPVLAKIELSKFSSLKAGTFIFEDYHRPIFDMTDIVNCRHGKIDFRRIYKRKNFFSIKKDVGRSKAKYLNSGETRYNPKIVDGN
jgi:hypothetical protein